MILLAEALSYNLCRCAEFTLLRNHSWICWRWHFHAVCVDVQNSPYWEITAGFVGKVKAKVPITTLTTDSCQVTVDEILLTVKPKTLQHPSVQCLSASAHFSASNLLPADLDDQPMSQDIMTEGIMQIAGGIEGIVQQLQLQVCHCIAAKLWR